MKAACWYGKHDIRIESVPDPKILNPRDAIIRITTSAICGSDLHLYDGVIPQMKKGDILGHEFMGEVIEVGPEVQKLKIGDRVVVPFTISCGNCFFCKQGLFALCDNSNPNAQMAEKLYGYSGSALYGYSHIFGGYAGGQAEYVRVPFADVGPLKIPEGLADEEVLFLSDILPTGYMAADNCNIQKGDSIAIWGCGPVGLFAMKSAFLLGAARVFAIDSVADRLRMAEAQGCTVIDYTKTNVLSALKDLTGGRGPDACIDAVGMEAHGMGLEYLYDRAKMAVMLENDRPIVLREAILACRKGGVVSVPGVYAGFIDKVPFGAVFAKGLTIRAGQTHVHRYMPALLDAIVEHAIDPTFVITHRVRLDEVPDAYSEFLKKQDHCVKVVIKP